MNKSKKDFIVKMAVLTVAVLILAGMGLYYSLGDMGEKAVAAIEIHPVDLNGVADGSYTGTYDAKLVKAKVSVTVSGGKITDIQLLEHVNGQGQNGEGVIPEVLDQQTVSVDVISGATLSSKTILKAIENALTQGQGQ